MFEGSRRPKASSIVKRPPLRALALIPGPERIVWVSKREVPSRRASHAWLRQGRTRASLLWK